MKAVEVNNLTFSYSGDDSFAMRNVSFDVERGEILLVIGESGCGKTTLLRHLKASQIPVGRTTENSRIFICGEAINEMSEYDAAFKVGFVGQQIEAAGVTDKVWHELAFGLESMGCKQEYMQQRVAEMTAFFGLENVYHKKLSELSGGEKQLVNLAAVMIMEPEILVLDEPTSQLDPNATVEFFHMIKKIHEELGTTIIITEHRLEDILPIADKVLLLDRGRVRMIGSAKEVCNYLFKNRMPMFRALPVAARIFYALNGCCIDIADSREKDEIPLSVNDGRRYLINYCERMNVGLSADAGKRNELNSNEKKNGREKKSTAAAVCVDEAWFRYKKDGVDVLKACSVNIEKGKITAILGGNGTGKSTLLHTIKGNLLPYLGKVKYYDSTLSLLPQNPQAMFAAKTVRDELAFADETVISKFDLEECLDKHPFDLSGGQMEKLALAKIVLEDNDVILLDEPGKGMDYAFKEKLGKYLKEIVDSGKSIILVSHDVEFCAKYADYCGLFFDGHIVSMNDAKTFFLQNSFYTTAVRRMCRGLFDAVTVEDVFKLLGVDDTFKNDDMFDGSSLSDDKWQDSIDFDDGKEISGEHQQNLNLKYQDVLITEKETVKKEWKRYLLSTAILLVLMPLTIYIGYAVLHQRKYYFISLMLIVEAVTALFVGFEGSKPTLKDIMTIAVMSTITALSRAMFYMVPAVKPMAALAIISGIGLGSVSGFVVGSLSMLVSDIFFGQGPWTPWQMFAMGFLGFLGGLIFKNDKPVKSLSNNKKLIYICIFGALVVLFIYGGIMNPASVLMYQENVTKKMLLASYATGFPIDCIHAAATFVFLWFLTEPMLEKLARVKKK